MLVKVTSRSGRVEAEHGGAFALVEISNETDKALQFLMELGGRFTFEKGTGDEPAQIHFEDTYD
jgi:hypothetical protein